jgi:pimeloyl-ACP methyl ester carboxylesterase
VTLLSLSSGAAARLTGLSADHQAVVCVNGGSRHEVEGDWSATLEWLVRRLAPSFPRLAFFEVRYRIKSWRRLDLCVEDARAAVELAVADGARDVALLGFSMGGAVSIATADHPSVTTVIGLAPWIPDRIDVSTLEGKRLAVVHGKLDAWVPGIPGVSPRHTLRGLERIRDRGIETTHSLVSGGMHGVAVHVPGGGLLRLPRAGHWATLVAEELERFQEDSCSGTRRLAR